ncbi:MAG: UDP-N-acetylmuramoyl-L-alanyl-D-glutamate--2,6-diaminopimelate ligase [Chloroflexota bacterium]|nr:UDP-N-acetylmuramoyl-L-alanyl-D-glutamate--2,6-diaminopimelate ligase [Chloroflexota bacterium]
MLLHQILTGLSATQVDGPTDIEITSIAYDSRAVQPGSLFIAINGFHTDGRAFIPQALARGAVAVVVQPETGNAGLGAGNREHSQSATIVAVENARTALAPIAVAFYDHPGAAMRVVGITGTDGKTTTTFLTSAVLEASGRATGMIGTVDFKVGARQWANETRQSTPEAPEVQALLRDMADAGCGYAVLEATSHALSARWNRLGGCRFDVALLTNVTHEHLDFHGSVEQYRRDKARLFEMLGEDERQTTNDESSAHLSSILRPSSKNRKIAIVNADDAHHQMFLDAAPTSAERLTYAVHSLADVRAYDVVSSAAGLRCRVETPWGGTQLNLKLTGDFNMSNALAALTVGLAEDVPLDACVAALEAIPGVRGRMERIEQGQPFTVLVDYAHTPGAFEKLMSITRPLTNGHLIAVFGSAGERDREKRAIQGAVAARFCDFLVLTDEDPRLENRDAIIAEIARGAEQAGKREGSGYARIPDRPAAIRAALAHARPGDIVLLLGKGHESCIIYGDTKTLWDEAGEARAALRELGYGGDKMTR